MERFTIFGKAGCGFCTRAKEVLENNNLAMKYFDIHEHNISQADLEKTVGKPVETVPQIFHGQTYIGGYTELDTYLKAEGLIPA